MYSIVASEWYRYYAIRLKSTTFLPKYRASLRGILWLAEGSNLVAAKARTITCLSAVVSFPLHCINWPYGVLNLAKPEYEWIIVMSWSNLTILEYWLRNGVTRSSICLSIPRWMVCRISGMILVVDRCIHYSRTCPLTFQLLDLLDIVWLPVSPSHPPETQV